MRWGIIFPKSYSQKWGKFFQKFFYEYVIFASEPPFWVSKCHIWGGYGRGGGGHIVRSPHSRGIIMR